jgi:hypothetical protein
LILFFLGLPAALCSSRGTISNPAFFGEFRSIPYQPVMVV